MNCTGIMTEHKIKILTFTNIPGKVVQDTIFFLSNLKQRKESRIIAGEKKPKDYQETLFKFRFRT